MLVKDLKLQIADLPDDLEVFFRAKTNPCGNIVGAGKAAKSTYGSFGKSVDCLIIEPESENEGDSPAEGNIECKDESAWY